MFPRSYIPKSNILLSHINSPIVLDVKTVSLTLETQDPERAHMGN